MDPQDSRGQREWLKTVQRYWLMGSPSNLFPRCTAARFVFAVVEQTVDAAGLKPLPHSGEEPGKSRLIGTQLIPSPPQFN